jgi:hypothetical protein
MWRDSALCVALLAGLRLTVARGVASRDPKRTASTRWFVEHAALNVVIAATSAPALTAVARAPREALDPDAFTPWETHPFALRLALWLHLYHTLFYSMTWADALHHGVFVTSLCAPGAYFAWGALGNAQVFFMCGLPGALLYGLLAAQRLGRARAWHEPTVSAAVNVGLRAPGILWCVACFVAILRDPAAVRPRAPTWAIALQVVLAPLNGVYYASESVRRAWRKRA